ncbi:MAG: DcaP family trimeric outer membrane transporter [Bdellovibrionales bacterium]
MRKMSKSHLCIAASVLALAVGVGVPAHAQESSTALQAMQEQINTLQKQLAQIQAAQAKAEKATKVAAPKKAAPSNVVTVDDKGAFVLPGTGTTIKLGGFIKASVVHDLSARPTLASTQDSTTTDGTSFNTIPTSADTGNLAGRRSNTTRFTARETRLNLTTKTPTSYGPFETVIEMDFYGAGGTATATNSYNPRLRRAYGSFYGFLVGQEWTTFADLQTKPETFDVNGPAAQPAIRQPMIRYTHDFKDGNVLAVALENPETDIGAAGATTPTTINNYPDMILSWKYSSDWGHIAARALGRNLAIDSIPAAAKYEQNKWGYGLAASGKWKPFRAESGAFSKDNILFMVEGGRGIGRYLAEAANLAAVTDANTDMYLLNSWGGNVTYQHFWTDALRSSFVYGYAYTEQKSFMDANAQKSADSVHANLIWSPVPAFDVGLEYIWGHRVVHNNAQGYMNRLQATAIYRF